MNESHKITPFRRFGVVLSETVWIDGEPFFSAKAIAEWLGLEKGRRSVNKIVGRHAFIKQFSKKITVVDDKDYQQRDGGPKMGTQCPLQNPENAAILNLVLPKRSGKNASFSCPFQKEEVKRTRKIELTVFNAVGLQLIAMKCHTKKAQEYQIAAARVLAKLMEGKLKEINPEQLAAEEILALQSKAKPGKKGKLLELYAKKTGCTIATAYRHLAMVKKGESPSDKKWGNFCKPKIAGDLELQIRQLFFADPEQSMKEIYRQLDEKKRPSYTTVKEFIHKLKKELEASKAFEVDLDLEPVQ